MSANIKKPHSLSFDTMYMYMSTVHVYVIVLLARIKLKCVQGST